MNNYLEEIPIEILYQICNKLNDYDFIQFITINKYFQQYVDLIELENKYKCSSIINLKNKYKITKIIYDYYD